MDFPKRRLNLWNKIKSISTASSKYNEKWKSISNKWNNKSNCYRKIKKSRLKNVNTWISNVRRLSSLECYVQKQIVSQQNVKSKLKLKNRSNGIFTSSFCGRSWSWTTSKVPHQLEKQWLWPRGPLNLAQLGLNKKLQRDGKQWMLMKSGQ